MTSSPLGFAGGPLEDVVASVEVHDPVLELELPLVSGTSDLVKLTNYDLKIIIQYLWLSGTD